MFLNQNKKEKSTQCFLILAYLWQPSLLFSNNDLPEMVQIFKKVKQTVTELVKIISKMFKKWKPWLIVHSKNKFQNNYFLTMKWLQPISQLMDDLSDYFQVLVQSLLANYHFMEDSWWWFMEKRDIKLGKFSSQRM